MDCLKLRTSMGGVSRLGALFCTLGILVFVTGCPGIFNPFCGLLGIGCPPPAVEECDDNADCGDLEFCNGRETCDPDNADAGDDGCVAGTAECPEGECNEEALRCDKCGLEGQAACDDGDACTDDACVDGQCTASAPTDCDDGDACNGVETCDTATGDCVAGTAVECAAGEVCADGVCVCADDSACDDGDACNGAETCDVATGACVAGTPVD